MKRPFGRTKPIFLTLKSTLLLHVLFSSVILFTFCCCCCHGLQVTTFNMLAPVHRSMDAIDGKRRESQREEWWRPRAEFLAQHVSTQLGSSDVILLQEWWFCKEFQDVFDYHVSPQFERVAEQRPGNRQDGMAVLIKRGGDLELTSSQSILTAPERIAQLVTCRHSHDNDDRQVVLANVHLQFPSSPDSVINARRQACQVQKVVRALSKLPFHQEESRLEIVGGDFNSNSGALPAKCLETQHRFVNCASAAAEQALSHTGGQVNLGMTHKQHDGLLVSVDHVFARVVPTCMKTSSDILRRYGYLDAAGTRIVDCIRGDLELECPSGLVVSDHRPVTATLEWPSPTARSQKTRRPLLLERDFCNMPLDPLEPPSYMGGHNMTTMIRNGLRP